MTKRIIALSLLLFLPILILAQTAQLTPFFYQGYNQDGSANTNALQISAWPPTNWFTVNGTNIIYGNFTITLLPNASGYATSSISAGQYRVLQTNGNVGFFINVPVSTNTNSLATYALMPITSLANNVLGTVKAEPTDTTLSFLGADISGTGLVTITTNLSGGISSFVFNVATNLPTYSITNALQQLVLPGTNTVFVTNNSTGVITINVSTTATGYSTLNVTNTLSTSNLIASNSVTTPSLISSGTTPTLTLLNPNINASIAGTPMSWSVTWWVMTNFAAPAGGSSNLFEVTYGTALSSTPRSQFSVIGTNYLQLSYNIGNVGLISNTTAGAVVAIGGTTTTISNSAAWSNTVVNEFNPQ